jgi:hypothetical protein
MQSRTSPSNRLEIDIGGLLAQSRRPAAPLTSYVVTVEVTGTPGSRSTVRTYNLGCPGARGEVVGRAIAGQFGLFRRAIMMLGCNA